MGHGTCQAGTILARFDLVQDQDAHPEGKRICSFDSVISGSEISDIHSREDLRESSREVATPSQPP